jgi:hypothetical protein
VAASFDDVRACSSSSSMLASWPEMLPILRDRRLTARGGKGHTHTMVIGWSSTTLTNQRARFETRKQGTPRWKLSCDLFAGTPRVAAQLVK